MEVTPLEVRSRLHFKVSGVTRVLAESNPSWVIFCCQVTDWPGAAARASGVAWIEMRKIPVTQSAVMGRKRRKFCFIFCSCCRSQLEATHHVMSSHFKPENGKLGAVISVLHIQPWAGTLAQVNDRIIRAIELPRTLVGCGAGWPRRVPALSAVL